ncbi:MAG: GNAT family N-acetyltransferase [Bifidobacteriaceae bacterium]|nr:GNAT family N-acetyltransferase [Bifidobacteriaceae bacterium]
MTFQLTPRRTRPRTLRPGELGAAVEFCAAAGADGVMAGARIDQARAGRAVGEVWAVERRGTRGAGRTLAARHIEALAWAGGNLIPVGAGPETARAFGAQARSRGARYASIVGEAGAVAAIWEELERSWPPPRCVRMSQPCLELAGPALVAPDPLVRPATSGMLERLVPACRAMFEEELGFPPPGPPESYRAHVAQQVARGNILARLDPADGRVLFKAELGSECGDSVQVQGVWTDPAWRGRGIAKRGMAAVAAEARRRSLANVSLYVNDFNAAALAVYRAVGFRQVSTWATVMF